MWSLLLSVSFHVSHLTCSGSFANCTAHSTNYILCMVHSVAIYMTIQFCWSSAYLLLSTGVTGSENCIFSAWKEVCHALYSKCSMTCSCIALRPTEAPDSEEIGSYPEGPSGIFSFNALTSKPDILICSLQRDENVLLSDTFGWANSCF